jgi:hypothetical protein
LGDTSLYGSPEKWINREYEDIIHLRMSLLRARVGQSFVKDVDDSLLIDISVAKRSIDAEIEADSYHRQNQFSNYHQPMGPVLDVKRIEIVSNPQPNRHIEKVVYDDMLAVDGVEKLYKKEIPVSKISQVLSAGQLGVKRKLVPTRWSITATDDIVSKHLVSYIKHYESLDDYRVFETEALGNHYIVLLFPHSFCFELMEAWFKGSLWANETTVVSDHEFHEGRKRYASNVTGSYYAARLAVAEYLHSIGRQAGCIIFREVRSSYIVPLGVWQVRENMREAMKQHNSFNTLQEALNYSWSRLNITSTNWRRSSKILEFISTQKKLSDF